MACFRGGVVLDDGDEVGGGGGNLEACVPGGVDTAVCNRLLYGLYGEGVTCILCGLDEADEMSCVDADECARGDGDKDEEGGGEGENVIGGGGDDLGGGGAVAGVPHGEATVPGFLRPLGDLVGHEAQLVEFEVGVIFVLCHSPKSLPAGKRYGKLEDLVTEGEP